MSDTRAFVKQIGPDAAYGASSPDEDGFINQSSPSWILTFIRWSYRDTVRISNSISAQQSPNLIDKLKAVEKPLVVRNDCISITTNSDKGSYTPRMEAVLLETNVDYLTEVAPGDFVFVNMLNWESDAEDVAIRANSATSNINKIDDGFKGVFKVQSVRKTVSIVNPELGTKAVVVRITGYAFTEFNNMIYFNQAVSTQTNGQLAFNARIAEIWKNIITSGNPASLSTIILQLIEAFLGTTLGAKDIGSENGANISQVKLPKSTSVLQSPNSKFFMPASVGKLLGIDSVSVAADIYSFVFGIQFFDKTNPSLPLYKGMNPSGLIPSGRAWLSNFDCSGNSILKPEYWNQVKAWDILKQYTNSPLNEFFACFRVHPNDDKIVPTVVFRQIPFTSEDFAIEGATVPLTRFLTLPRWKLSPSLVLSQDLGRDEAARINFVQVFGKTMFGSEGTDYAAETARVNYVEDINDIQRSGLRPAVLSSMFDILPQGKQEIYRSVEWAKIIGDSMIGGHLKFNGTITCVGIEDPIAVGDNLEYDGVVYHIESISHKCTIGAEGKKSFRTTLSLSQGISVNSSAKYGTLYPSMKYGNAYKERKVDSSNSNILPGVSESQSIPERGSSLDQKAPLVSPNESFPQPKEIKVFPDAPNKPRKVK